MPEHKGARIRPSRRRKHTAPEGTLDHHLDYENWVKQPLPGQVMTVDQLPDDEDIEPGRVHFT